MMDEANMKAVKSLLPLGNCCVLTISLQAAAKGQPVPGKEALNMIENNMAYGFVVF